MPVSTLFCWKQEKTFIFFLNAICCPVEAASCKTLHFAFCLDFLSHLHRFSEFADVRLFSEQTNVVSVNKRLHHRVEGRDMSCAILGRAPKEHQGSSKIGMSTALVP